MIESMTGFGKAEVQLPSKKVSVEIRSLNSKNLDIMARIPSEYKDKELEIRQEIGKKLSRGKVSFSIQIEATGIEGAANINKEVVQKYIQELQEIVATDSSNLLEIAMRLPDAISNEKEDIDPKEWGIIENTIEEAMDEIVNYRKVEGAVLKRDFENRIGIIHSLLERIVPFDAERKKLLVEKLKKAVEDLEVKVDENRFEQELIFYLEKLDITEEQVRLKNHLEYYIEMLNSDSSNGKKLAFITQEMGREINTLGSKANYAPMQKLVIQMKDELEKIKEQNLNIL